MLIAPLISSQGSFFWSCNLFLRFGNSQKSQAAISALYSRCGHFYIQFLHCDPHGWYSLTRDHGTATFRPLNLWLLSFNSWPQLKYYYSCVIVLVTVVFRGTSDLRLHFVYRKAIMAITLPAHLEINARWSFVLYINWKYSL